MKQKNISTATMDKKAMELILRDEPLEALKLLKKDSPLRRKLVKKLDHIFNPATYLKKYADDPMGWRPEFINYPRHGWILQEIINTGEVNPTLLDLGCYEGSLVKRFDGSAKGVEICKEAVILGQTRGLNIVQGDACTYKDSEKYDAVCACELIEHIAEPKDLIKNMLKLVSNNGWCYATTPNGCCDPQNTLASWENDDSLIDHVRTYSEEKLQKLLKGLRYEIQNNNVELWFKFQERG